MFENILHTLCNTILPLCSFPITLHVEKAKLIRLFFSYLKLYFPNDTNQMGRVYMRKAIFLSLGYDIIFQSLADCISMY